MAETGNGPLQRRVQAGRHVWLADEPATSGGEDSGPTPYDLLLAALGTCTSMTLRMVANHKGLSLDRVRVELHHSRIHAEDCANCASQASLVERIDRLVYMDGELSAAERERLVQIADRCPVHQTLHGPIEVHTREASDEV